MSFYGTLLTRHVKDLEMKVSLNAFAGRLFEIVKNKTMNLENIFPRQMPDLSSLKLINEYMYHFFINLNKYMKGFNFYHACICTVM